MNKGFSKNRKNGGHFEKGIDDHLYSVVYQTYKGEHGGRTLGNPYGHPQGREWLQLFQQAIALIPQTALLLECSFVSGFGYLEKKVYTFLKDEENDK